MSAVGSHLRESRGAARKAADLSASCKRRLLHRIADTVTARLPAIREVNDAEVQAAGRSRLPGRAALGTARLTRIIEGIRWLADAPDPVGTVEGLSRRPNGLLVGRMRVPLGLIAAVYEARPEITLEAAAMAIKSGNAIVLRGGSECLGTNQALAEVVRSCLRAEGVPEEIVAHLSDASREAVWELLAGSEPLDLVVVRGGDAFVDEVRRRCPYPVLASGAGNCHIFVDAGADLEQATAIVLNSKLSAPQMCNAVETVLVHEALAADYLPVLLGELRAAGVDVRGCPATLVVDPSIVAATEEDWAAEFLDHRLAVRVVRDVEAAIDHIGTYGTGHSEAILTRDLAHAGRFQRQVDAAAVYVNASTRFTYGYEFGTGPMLGISTQKLHARGPVGVMDLTSQKFVITGSGHMRETP